METHGSAKAYAPFTLNYSPQVPELMFRLGCTLAISTYQAGKLIFISAKDENALIQLPRNFEKPMGIALSEDGNNMALACKNQIITFANSPDLALHYPKSPGKYDALYMPRTTYHTGPLDIHDLRFGADKKLFAVNTLFSCVVEIDQSFNFKPYWSPPAITELVSEDRCHLNGMVMQNGKPKYATAFNQGNSAQSWRDTVATTGVMYDIEANELIAEGLPMPHSPMAVGDDLYVLLSATGELAKIDKATGKYDVITKYEGFVRGMSLVQDYLFIGLSKLRKNSSTFAKLPFAEKANQSGVLIVHLPTGSIAGQITYQTSVDEIYDVHAISGKRRPNILNTITNDHYSGLMIPGTTYWAVPTNN